MRKKQICIALIIVAIILVLSAVLVACNRNQQSDKTDKDPDQPHKHSYVYVEAKEPTCIENGNNAYYTCSCGKYFDLNKREVEYSEYVYIANTLEHKYGEWIPEGTFVCGDLVNAYRLCETCGHKDTTDRYIVPLPHIWNTNGYCDVCGMKKPKEWQVVDGHLECGEYPQSRADSEIETVLTAGCTAPSKGSSEGWTNYNYYCSDAQDEYMWYKDVTHNNEKYRGVYFSKYRPSPTKVEGSEDYSLQDDNGYETGVMYWFKYEPIVWNVIEDSDGELMLLSAAIIDNQQFYHGIDDRIEGSETIRPCNYDKSDIRQWLNSVFYDWAFDEEAKAIIQNTEVDNSAVQGGDGNNLFCANTMDNVFILSVKEVKDMKSNVKDSVYRLGSTDYAKCQGAETQEKNMTDTIGEGKWMTRSPGGTWMNVRYIKDFGTTSYATMTCSLIGVAPSIKVKLSGE